MQQHVLGKTGFSVSAITLSLSKNRAELDDAIAAAQAGPLPSALMERITTLQQTRTP